MSPALSQLSGKQIIAALEKIGFEHVSTKGSHAKLRHSDGRRTIVPLHRTVARGTLSSIFLQAGVTAQEFQKLLS
ncbi:type II toxin-antitoxin system HicA family toxin [Pseudonocardia spinosispora]|uniref:type II toxin-antitoxin system HicA family toxin n=1 Tax=Pseudonocardia spinosispora TaxID=103441 RepID=UPI000420ACB2|nr:type II toxin-antitoxin system HicA family toxin [Pseudonocardia spinosispora]